MAGGQFVRLLYCKCIDCDRYSSHPKIILLILIIVGKIIQIFLYLPGAFMHCRLNFCIYDEHCSVHICPCQGRVHQQCSIKVKPSFVLITEWLIRSLLKLHDRLFQPSKDIFTPMFECDGCGMFFPEEPSHTKPKVVTLTTVNFNLIGCMSILACGQLIPGAYYISLDTHISLNRVVLILAEGFNSYMCMRG